MSKSIKLNDNTYWDSKSVDYKHTNLETTIDNLNSNVAHINLSSVGQTYAASYEFGNYTIPSKGTYLMIGYGQLNYYGESGRELFFIANKNWTNELCRSGGVINVYAYSLIANLVYVGDFNAGDVIHIYVSNSSTAKSWSFPGGVIHFIKLK